MDSSVLTVSLFNAVLGVKTVIDVNRYANLYSYNTEESKIAGIPLTINVYEFSYRCKRWAEALGYEYRITLLGIFIRHIQTRKEYCVHTEPLSWTDLAIDIIACNTILKTLLKESK